MLHYVVTFGDSMSQHWRTVASVATLGSKVALPCTMHLNHGVFGLRFYLLNIGMLDPENRATSRPSGWVRTYARYTSCFLVTIALVSERQRSFLHRST